MELCDKTVLVTGASSGMGRGMALELGRRGNRLVVTARREERLRALADEIEAAGGRCLPIAGDSIDPAHAKAVLDAGLAEFGRIDLAILNAGGGSVVSMAEAEAETVLRMMRTNYDTLVNYLCPVIAHMKAAGGVIAYTGSPAGYFGLPKSGPYSAAKAAGRVLVDACRIELAGTDVRFVALYPGFTRTEGLDPDDVPVPALIIDAERAVAEMLGAIERERSHHMFPKRIKGLMTLARALPEPLRRRALALAS